MRIIITILIGLILISCGNSANETSSDASTDIQTTEESCLAKYAEDNSIENLINKEDFAKIINQPVASIEYKDNKSSTSKYSNIKYEWPADEERLMIMEIDAGGGRTVRQEMAIDNGVNIGNVDVIDDDKEPLAYFNRLYAPKSAEDKERVKKQIDAAAESSDKIDAESSKTVKSMLDAESYKMVDNVGDAAYFEVKSHSNVEVVYLNVLHGNVMFRVSSDVSKNPKEDLEMSKKIAQAIIAQCE